MLPGAIGMLEWEELGLMVGCPLNLLELLEPTLDIDDVRSRFGRGIAGPGNSSSASADVTLSVTLLAKLGSEGLPHPPGKPLVGGESDELLPLP